MIKKAISEKWTKELQEEAQNKSTLRYLNVNKCHLGMVHPVWQNINSDLDLKKATIKAQLLLQRYPLASTKLAGPNRNETCPLCKEENEDTTHFLFLFSATRSSRVQHLTHILSSVRKKKISIDLDTLVRITLDSTYMAQDDILFEKMTRNMVFKLHHCRNVLLGGNSTYAEARRQ